jgi:hypothetical protein
MQEASARNLRTGERFLIQPPLSAQFGPAVVSVCDISRKAARFKHKYALTVGQKSVLRLAVEQRGSPITLEAVVIWTQRDTGARTGFTSGVQMFGSAESIDRTLRHLQNLRRTTRIDELRSADRFYVTPALDATWDRGTVRVGDLSAHGARIETSRQLSAGGAGVLKFSLRGGMVAVNVHAGVVWTSVKAVAPSSYHAGLLIKEKTESVRLAIGQLCESGRASIDTHSLALKLKIIRARARQVAPSYRDVEKAGVPAEQYLLVQGVREELRLNPEEAMHWYRRARMLIKDPSTRAAAPSIADHPDALAVWEYLDCTIDPSVISRTFELPPR